MKEQTVYKVEEARQLTVQQSLPAVLIIGLGVMMLASNILGFRMMEFFWPGFVMAPGLLLMWPAANATAERPSRLSFLAVPGAIFIAVGLLLFGMNLTGHFEAWAYSWTLLPAAAVVGLMYARRFDRAHTIHQSGHKLIRTMVMLFMGLALFFELIVFENFNPLLPALLIAYGLYLLARNRRTAV
jgi:hypothetical protein